MSSIKHTVVVTCALLGIVVTNAFAADDPVDRPSAASVATVIGPQYRASGIHRWLWGTEYRPLWMTPIKVEVLDLHSFAGGLTPLFRVGGRETRGLALKGADGRTYTFRAIDKDATSILPGELQDTWVRNIVKDQIAANHPASFFVVDELMGAAGLLRVEQQFKVMPDDPALGEFRKDFAGLAGQVYEFPTARSDKSGGFMGATQVLTHAEFYRRMEASPQDRPDARAFLKARLFDIMIGDWDRHRDQWKWARLPGSDAWQPIPEDRDEAFSRFEGLATGFARTRVPIFQNYSASYPGMKGLTWNGWDQDRWLLAGLERAQWTEVANELKAEMTDAVIAKAVRRMPAEYQEIDAKRLAHDLEGRRDQLLEGADAFYRHIADKVQVHLTDVAEHVEVKHLPGGDTLVQAWARGADGKPVAEPFYRRTLRPSETEEAQIYLRGGDDRVVTVGEPNRIAVRVIGGPGHDVVDDSAGGGSRFYTTAVAEIVRGPGSRLQRRAYTPPDPPVNAPWIPPRDWGRDTFIVPWLGLGSDMGLFVGAGIDTQAHGFRKDPYASRHILKGGWSFGERSYRADYRADIRFENGMRAGGYAYASGVENTRFFGFGNESSDGGDPKSSFWKVKSDLYSVTPALTFPVMPNVSFSIGPTVKYASTEQSDDATLLDQQRPYGYGDFGMVGATGLLVLDTRVAAARTPGGATLRSMGYPRSGAFVKVRGQVWPAVWDVTSTFGSVDGSAAAYLTPRGGFHAPTLALQVGGRKAIGAYPYFEAAYLGGGLGGFGFSTGDEPIRGLPRHRYAGDGAVFGNADVRLPISRFRIILPGEWGLVGFADGGRVYLSGESSEKWHYGAGAGLWFAWLDRANTLSVSYARSEGHNSFYVRAGFGF